MPTLYRKYRPQKFNDVFGQEHIVKTLTNEISSEKIAHAYLFSGPRGTGKTTLARLLAKAINCTNRSKDKFEPCDECSSCQEITAGRNIDVIEVDAASQTGVENVRENIIENAQFRPTKSPFKVFIIDEVHMLSGSAFNALLKTLEEPPAHAIFILATTELHKLPATIVSRCQRFNFKKLPAETLIKKLQNICEEEKIKVDKIVLEKIALKSDGCLRDAESLLGQIFSLNLKKITADDVANILPEGDWDTTLTFLEETTKGQAVVALKIIQDTALKGINLESFAETIIQALRLLLFSQAGAEDALLQSFNTETAARIKKLATNLPPEILIKMTEAALKRNAEIRLAPLPQLPLELLAIEYSSLKQEKDASPTVALLTVEKTVEKKRSAGEAIKSTLSAIAGKHLPKITLEELTTKWPELIKCLSADHPSITFILNMCQLKKIDTSGLHLTVPYSFHKEKIEEPKTHQLLTEHLQTLCGEKINLCCEVVATPVQNQAPEQELNSLAAEFGGKIME